MQASETSQGGGRSAARCRSRESGALHCDGMAGNGGPGRRRSLSRPTAKDHSDGVARMAGSRAATWLVLRNRCQKRRLKHCAGRDDCFFQGDMVSVALAHLCLDDRIVEIEVPQVLEFADVNV